MKEQYLSPVTTAIKVGVVGLAFLTPLFFLPITSEFYQFNKQVLIVVMAAILLILWGVKMAIEGKMRIVRTPLDIPLLLFGLAFLIATIFSVDKYVSIFGFYPRFHGSLVSALAYIVVYFVAVSNLDKNSRTALIWAFIGSGLVLALASTVNFFGYSVLSVDYTKVRNWTPIGSVQSLALYLALLIPLSLGLMVTGKNKNLQIAALLITAVLFIPLFLFKITGVIIAIVLAVAVTALFWPRVKVGKDTQALLGVLGIILVVFALLTYIPSLRDSFLSPLLAKKQTFDLPADSSIPLDSAWKISTQAVGQRPFFGVGPGTFAYSFTELKGTELNTDSLWNLRFDLSGNDYLTTLSTVGIIGLLSFFLVIFAFGRTLFTFNYQSSTIKDNPTSIFLLASLIIFVVGIFFQDTTATIWLFFVLLGALTFSFMKDWGVDKIEEMDVRLVALNSGGVQFSPANNRNRDSAMGTIFTVLGVVAFLMVLYYGVPIYSAEMAYEKALVASNNNKAADTHTFLIDAINANPYRDTYHRSLAVLDRLLAINLSNKANKTDQDNQNLAGLVNEAVAQGVIVTGYQGQGLNSFSIRPVPGTASLNVANWEALSNILSSLTLPTDQQAKNAADAINVAQQAVALDPKNPLLLESLGNILMKNNLVDDAVNAYTQAINVRPAYANAHYDLAQALKKKGDNPARVVFELQNTLALLPATPANKTDRSRLNQELAAAQKKLNEATQSAKPAGK